MRSHGGVLISQDERPYKTRESHRALCTGGEEAV